MPAQDFRYKRLRKRLKRTFYYGRNDRMDQLSFPMSELSQEYFDKNSPFDYLDMDFATTLSKEGCVSPCSLIVAMIYMDRFRDLNRDQFEASDPADIYMSALLVASKYLNDDGETDYVYNDEWAASAQKPLKHVNEQEIKILTGIEWKLMIEAADFYRKLKSMEMDVARKEVKKRGSRSSLTYTELHLLSTGFADQEFLWATVLQPFLAVMGLASLVYSASILALYAATISVSCMPSMAPPPLPATHHGPRQTRSASLTLPPVKDSCSEIVAPTGLTEISLDLDLRIGNGNMIGNEDGLKDSKSAIANGKNDYDSGGIGGGFDVSGLNVELNNESDFVCAELGVNLTDFRAEFEGLKLAPQAWILGAIGSG